MLRHLVLAAGLMAGTLAFGQSNNTDPLAPAQAALDRAQAVLDHARAILEQAAQNDDSKAEDPIAFVPFQIGFVPGMAIPFGYYDVGLSLGTVGTLTRDVNGLAGASVFNLSRDIHGAEFAGVFNIARKVAGAQLAGVFNIADGSMSALQSAGVFNIAGGSVSGSQLSGVFNIGGSTVEGAQLAGIFNIGGQVRGMQAAGLFNISKSYYGPFDIAGLFAISGDVRGAELAGLFTVADNLRGVQISPLVNVAGSAHGLQIGLVNVADTMDGIQLGLINIAKNGVGGIGELFEGNSNYQWAYWQNGTPAFFTMFMAGSPRDEAFSKPDHLIAMAGAGSRLYLGRPYIDLQVEALWDVGASAARLGDRLGAIGGGRSSETLIEMGNAFSSAAELFPLRPWPALSMTVGIPLLWRLHVVGGLRMDMDLDQWPAMPERMKTGIATGHQDWFGLGFNAWTKWYFGFRI